MAYMFMHNIYLTGTSKGNGKSMLVELAEQTNKQASISLSLQDP